MTEPKPTYTTWKTPQCIEANRLRQAWYDASDIYRKVIESRSVCRDSVYLLRKELEMQTALDAYKAHRRECPACRAQMEEVTR